MITNKDTDLKYNIKLKNTNGIYINHKKNIGIGIDAAYIFNNEANAQLFLYEFLEQYKQLSKCDFEIVKIKENKSIFNQIA